MVRIPAYRAVALGFFRSSVFFVVAVAAFAQREDRTGTILTTLVFLIDVATYHLLQVMVISNESVYSRVWRDTLANRFFYQKLLEDFRDRQHVDVEALFKQATARSGEDIKTYPRDATFWSEWGGSNASCWRFPVQCYILADPQSLLGVGYVGSTSEQAIKMAAMEAAIQVADRTNGQGPTGKRVGSAQLAKSHADTCGYDSGLGGRYRGQLGAILRLA
jgi:hypothetical protein